MPEGREIGALGEKAKGIKKYKLAVTKQSLGTQYTATGNTVNDTVITMYAATWALEILLEGSLCKVQWNLSTQH